MTQYAHTLVISTRNVLNELDIETSNFFFNKEENLEQFDVAVIIGLAGGMQEASLSC